MARFKKFLFIALSIFLGLLCAELIVRAYTVVGGGLGQRLARFNSAPSAMPIELYGQYGFRQKPNETFHYGNGTRASSNDMGYRGPVLSRAKPEGTFRIVLLGGSATHGFGVNDDQTIDAHLRRILPQRYPGARFEVANLAYDGYDSYQVYLRMQSDGVRLSPDLVIVNSGVNDVRNALFADLQYPDRRTLGWAQVLSSMEAEQQYGLSLWTVAKRRSYLIRLPSFARQLAFERRQLSAQKALVKPSPLAIDYFEKNIRATAALTRQVGAGLILSTPASALSTRYESRETSNRSYWIVDAATTEAYRQSLARRMREVAAELRQGGERVRYVSHDLPPGMFLDDCHLTDAGNRAVAATFADSARPFIKAALRGGPVSAFSSRAWEEEGTRTARAASRDHAKLISR